MCTIREKLSLNMGKERACKHEKNLFRPFDRYFKIHMRGLRAISSSENASTKSWQSVTLKINKLIMKLPGNNFTAF